MVVYFRLFRFLFNRPRLFSETYVRFGRVLKGLQGGTFGIAEARFYI